MLAERRAGGAVMSWAPEVIADNSGKFCGNALRFATREEAEANVRDLAMRWTSVRDTRVVESPDPVNYAVIDGRLVRLEEDPR
jgi:hypothetical protein